MRIKLFEQFEDIHETCKKYDIGEYTVNVDGTVDVRGDVVISHMGLSELPIRFGKVSGDFYCINNLLKSLDGSPKEVGGSFYCDNNMLTTLVGSPETIVRSFSCKNNMLKTLEGSPRYVGSVLFCKDNKLWTLFGGPEKIGMGISVIGNPVASIFRIFFEKLGYYSYEKFMESLDWNYLRDGKIIKSRFEEACEEAGVEVPKSIVGYEYI